MCLKLSEFRIGHEVVQRPCGDCWQCRENKVLDWCGRCLAEARSASSVTIMTLTYAGDVPGSVVLLNHHVQGLWKRLRSAGYPVRYIVTGEYGALHGRAHWHAVVFWQKDAPDLPPEGKFGDWSFWPHGHVHIGRWDFAWLRYTLKYILKDTDKAVSAYRLMMSKKPPLGYDYFMGLADDMVEARVMPNSFLYTMPGIAARRGPVQFLLKDRMRELFADRLHVGWRLRWGVPPPETDFMEAGYSDYIERKHFVAEYDAARLAALEEHAIRSRDVFRVVEDFVGSYTSGACLSTSSPAYSVSEFGGVKITATFDEIVYSYSPTSDAPAP